MCWPVYDPVIGLGKVIPLIELQINIQYEHRHVNMCLEVEIICFTIFIIIIIHKGEIKPDIQPEDTIVESESKDEGLIGMIDQVFPKFIIHKGNFCRLNRSIQTGSQMIQVRCNIISIRIARQLLQYALCMSAGSTQK